MEPRIQYAKTSDGVNIAYWTLGQGGEPLLIMSPLAVSHIALEWRFASLRSWYEHLAASSRMIVRYDPRCSGMSQRGVADLSPGARLLDIDAVVASLGLERFGLIAGYASGRFGIAYAADHPQRVSKLATWCEGMPSTKARRWSASPAMLSLAEEDWQAYTETFSHRLFGWSKGKDAHEWASLLRDSTTSEDSLRGLISVFGFDFRNRLADVRSPTLVLHHTGYRAVEPSEATKLAAGIPGSQLVMIAGTFEPLHECAAAMDAIDEFFEITPPAAASSGADLPTSTAVILFADIVDSTGLTERMGDAAFREKARKLDGALRTAIRGGGGTPVEGKLLGDGVLAVFISARQAIEAALRCGRAGDESGLPLHLGIHAGDVIREADNVYGGAVNIASRISGLSAPGEVLVSETVRSLARTSAGVRFEERGEQALKGVGEAVRVWVVREGEA